MQQRDQSRTAFVNEAKFLFDPGTDLARRARQRRADECFQCVFLRGAQKARVSAHVKTGQALDPTLFKQFEPAADRVVVQQQRSSDFLTAPTVVQKHQGVCASRHTRGHRPIARQRDQLVAILFAEETTSNHSTSESAKLENSRNFYRDFNESGYMPIISWPSRFPRCPASPRSSSTGSSIPRSASRSTRPSSPPAAS